MNKKLLSKLAFIIGLLMCFSFSSCGLLENQDSESNESEITDLTSAIKNSDEQLELLELYLQQYQQNQSDANLQQLKKQIEKCYFNFSDDNLSVDDEKRMIQQRIKVENVLKTVSEQLGEDIGDIQTGLVEKDDYLMDKGKETFPFYAKKGDVMKYSVSSSSKFTIKIYNADSHALVKSAISKTKVNDSITISNTAIYLFEVTPTKNQYADISLKHSSSDLSQMGRETPIFTQEIEAKKGDFGARSVTGVEMKSIFEEPRKFTLRGQLKSMFSGSARALVALNVPKGATDVLYSLRISTNETDKYSDGKFQENMNTSYHKIKFMGLPLYESSRSSGLIATLLGENVPIREEDAYINMYVFFDSKQAKKFQDGEPASQLKYSVDYSTLGTQSCNGRIPAKGKSTIYLAFENERMRYNNYVWLEAISTVPHTEYYKTQYSIK